jgi:hypothetical protein
MSEENNFDVDLEKLSLLPDRYYIILSEGENDGELRMTAYDTTGNEYDKDEDFNAAMIIQEGLLSALRDRPDEMYDMGVASIEFRIFAEELAQDETIPVPEDMGKNVVKVDFGKKQ